jgi:Transmembrane domain of unknown function (DUF3566)
MSQTTSNVPAEPTQPARRPTHIGAQAPATSPTQEVPSTPVVPGRPLIRRPRPTRRTRVVIRRLGPWSVLKFSLFFYFCVWLIVFLALVIIYMLMSAVGAIDSLEKLLGYLFATGEQSTRGPTPIEVNEGVVGLVTFLGGCVLTLVWSLINVLVAFLYNLISDVVGGVEVTLAEKRPGEATPPSPVR